MPGIASAATAVLMAHVAQGASSIRVGAGGVMLPNALRTRYPVEWLADNGSCFTAHETVAFAHAIGLVPCFTPVRSPQSNGIAEAFVKTFKRDYVRLSARPDATALLAELDRWFEDYNEMHPHRALGMRSPREFIRAHQLATCPV